MRLPLPHPDPLVDVLLAPLAPDVYAYQRRERGTRPERIVAALTALADSVLRAGPE